MSSMSEIANQPFTGGFDWDIFSNGDDEDNSISFEEMFEVTEVSSNLDQLEHCVSVEDAMIMPEPRNFFEQENNNINAQDADTIIKLEDLFDSDITSSQATVSSGEFVDSQSSTWPNSFLSTSSPLIPEFDQLQNLPYEIVQRPRYIPFT
jgi:hypothetical protein